MKRKNFSCSNMHTYHIKEMIFVSSFKMTFTKFCLLTAIFLLAILISMLPFMLNNKRKQTNIRQARYTPDLKYILFWNHPKVKKLKSLHVRHVNEFESGQSSFINQKCPHLNCYISYNASLLGGDQGNFDAVVFDVHEVIKFKWNDYNFTRSPFQKYIFRSHEASDKHPICNPIFDDFFNWTWTYKLISNIPHPFISIYDVSNKLVGPIKNMSWIKTMNHSDSTKSKTNDKDKAVVWIVNKCKLKSKHQDFINDLRHELSGYNYTVDTYGPCGDNKCPGGQLSKCYKMAEREYYFQIVLEESSSEDYVTEKIVKALSYLTVPITLGDTNFTRFLPPGSYINAQAFDMKKLGALIDYLIKNPVVYEYFFDWKNHYFYTVRYRTDVCDLCAKLNENTDNYENYANLRQWWNVEYEDVCERMHLYHLFN